MAVLASPPYLQFFDADGDPLAGGMVYTYQAGTTTPKATYTDEGGLTENTNPVQLDSAGIPQPGGSIWLNGSYKFIVKDASGATIRTTDNVSAFTTVADAANSFFQSFSGNGSQTAFTLSENLGTDEKTVMVFVKDSGEFDIQNPSAFTLNGTALTFASAPPSGTNNIFVFAPSTLVGAASASAEAAASSATAASNSAAEAREIEVRIGDREAVVSAAAGRAEMSADRAEQEADRAEAAASGVDFTVGDAVMAALYFG